MPDENSTQNLNQNPGQTPTLTSDTNSETIGPQPITLPTFLFKLIAACGGGLAGSLVLLLFIVLGASVLTPLTDIANGDRTSFNPIFAFIVMAMVFFASTVSNLLSTWLLSLTEKEKYKGVTSAIYQIFIFSLLIFIFMAPVYFLAGAISADLIPYVIGLHIISTTLVSAISLELIANARYALIGLYSSIFAIIISAAVAFSLAQIIPSPTILLFTALPLIWGATALTYSATTFVYSWIARTYDKDFLAIDTKFGSDYGADNNTETTPNGTTGVSSNDLNSNNTPVAKDGAGADFLRMKGE